MTSPPPHQTPGPQPQPGWGPPVLPYATPPKNRRPWVVPVVVGAVALFLGVGIGSSGSEGSTATSADGKAAPRPTVTVTEKAEKAAKGDKGEPEPAVTVTKTVTAKPKQAAKPKKAAPAVSFSGEGEYLVGDDIRPGTYKTAGADGSFGCYWERAKDASGEFESIIANNNLEGPGRVTLIKGEYFKTNRCKEWTKVG